MYNVYIKQLVILKKAATFFTLMISHTIYFYDFGIQLNTFTFYCVVEILSPSNKHILFYFSFLVFFGQLNAIATH